MFAKGKALPDHSPAKGRKIHVKKKSKKGKKRCKNPLTRGNIFGKIIKLSEITESNTKLNNALKKILKSEKKCLTKTKKSVKMLNVRHHVEPEP